MTFTFEKSNTLNLKRSQWVVFKYRGFDKLDTGQISTSSAVHF
jgi:hypothetical protein